MANLPQQLNVNARNWTTESGSFVPPIYHIFFYHSHPSYSGIVYIIGDGSTVFSSLNVYISPWQGPFAGPLTVSSGGAEIVGTSGTLLDVGADQNIVANIGKCKITGSTDNVYIGHYDKTTSQAGFIQTGTTGTYLNVQTGGTIYISENLATLATFTGTDITLNKKLTVDRATATATDKIASFVSNVGGTDTENCYIEADGDIYNTNGTYGTISDLKLKENITDATEKLVDLLNVRIVNYELKREPGKKLLGVIAQELEEILPGLIKEVDDFEMLPDMGYELKPERIEKFPVMETVQTQKNVIVEENGKYIQKLITEMEEKPVYDEYDLYDESGKVIGKHKVQRCTEIVIPAETEEDRPMKLQKNGEVTKTVKMSVFVPMLIKAIQELNTKVEALS